MIYQSFFQTAELVFAFAFAGELAFNMFGTWMKGASKEP